MDVVVERANVRKAALVDAPPLTIAKGDVLLAVRKWSLTANNVSYAVAGDTLQYWNFWPTGEASLGRIPVWGTAEVVASRAPGVEVGRMVYGYLPMSSYVVMTPQLSTPHAGAGDGDDAAAAAPGFTDVTEHRNELPAAYNFYSFLDVDPFAQVSVDAMMLLRPLFFTSWLLNDFFSDPKQAFFGAREGSVVLSSASSKTSIGLAYMLSKAGQSRTDTPDEHKFAGRIVGLTSGGNVEFVESLGLYDKVVTYDKIKSQCPVEPAVYVDMSGNSRVLRDVHDHYGNSLKHSCAVGATHWEADRAPRKGLPGVRPAFFFAPSWVAVRAKQWGGMSGVAARMLASWAPFVTYTETWMAMKHLLGPEAVLAGYRRVVGGDIAPKEGIIMSLWKGVGAKL